MPQDSSGQFRDRRCSLFHAEIQGQLYRIWNGRVEKIFRRYAPIRLTEIIETGHHMTIFEISWLIFSCQDLRRSSKILSGFSALTQKGELNLRFLVRHPIHNLHGSLVYLVAKHVPTQEEKRIVFDLADSGKFINDNALRYADVYLKRSYDSDAVAKLSVEAKAKLQPFGLNFPCLTVQARPTLAKAAVCKWLRSLTPRDSRAEGGGYTFLQDFRLLSALPPPEQFICVEPHKQASFVIFQTRIWPPEPSDDDLEKLNWERMHLTEVLRRDLGKYFIGGIVADPYSLKTAPHLVTSTSTRRASYVRLMKGAQIGVYTRGIHNSIANKMSEYLAAGLCIVSEPFHHSLPINLAPGVNYLPFHTPEECVAQCQRLLGDWDLANAMSRANLAYYQQHLAPERHVRALLRSVFSQYTLTQAE